MLKIKLANEEFNKHFRKRLSHRLQELSAQTNNSIDDFLADCPVIGVIGSTNEIIEEDGVSKRQQSPFNLAKGLLGNQIRTTFDAGIVNDLIFWSFIWEMRKIEKISSQDWEKALMLFNRCTLVDCRFVKPKYIDSLFLLASKNPLMSSERLVYELSKKIDCKEFLWKHWNSNHASAVSIYGYELKKIMTS